MTTLTQTTIGSKVVVCDLACFGRMRQRLVDLGIFNGQEIRLIGVAPLGDPLIIEVGSTRMAIRRRDAAKIGIR